MSLSNRTIAVVIPCYRVRQKIQLVSDKIPSYVDMIYLVDDCCPEKTGEFMLERIKDQRIRIVFNKVNLGVGGAVCRGYLKAIEENIDIIVKLDGDDQMDPTLIKALIAPLVSASADYVKGNRFHKLQSLSQMPKFRLLGNTGLSFINKLVSGYWDIMDPTNGFTAISNVALKELPLNRISPRYFFESDILYNLGLAKAKVVDFPMDAKYSDEVSSLKIHQVVMDFPPRYLVRLIKRIFYQYILRDFNFGSLSLLLGLMFLNTGILFGAFKFHEYAVINNSPAPTGMVVIPSLLIMLGTQFLISFFQYDINSSQKNL